MVQKTRETYDGKGNLLSTQIIEIPDVPYDVARRLKFEQLDGEGMDAFRKEIAAIRAGQPETPEYAAYRLKTEEIKTQHRKP